MPPPMVLALAFEAGPRRFVLVVALLGDRFLNHDQYITLW